MLATLTALAATGLLWAGCDSAAGDDGAAQPPTGADAAAGDGNHGPDLLAGADALGAGEDAAPAPDLLAGADALGPGGDAEPASDAPAATDAPAAGCVPACAGAECGDDGCGGSCGACPGGQTCDASSGACGPAGLCPPQAPYGIEAGDTAVDVQLTDCDGVPHSLHDLCDKEAAWLFSYAHW
jgi:hypothetical protein